EIPPVTPEAAALSLLTADAVRTRAHFLLARGLDDKLPNFRIDLSSLDRAVDLVLATTRKAYPSLKVPFHSRWRHFNDGNKDRWAALDKKTKWKDKAARARAAFDLATISVLLDAGAGPAWRYRLPSGEIVGRSEGLALASLDMFEAGLFSSDQKIP